MTLVDKIEKEVVVLTDIDRAILASRLLLSLPAVLAEDDDGLAEALRRDSELDRSPESAVSMEEFEAFINAHRRG